MASFDPKVAPDPSSDHGRGLFIIACLMDDLGLRLDGGLEVRMARRAEPRCEPASLDSGLGERVAGSLGHREARTRATLEQIDEGFIALDWEYRYVYVNEPACRLLEQSRDELLGHKLFALFARLRGTELERGFRAAMELGRPSVLEWRSPVIGGWVEVRIYPTPAGVTAYFHDISERKRAEEEREQLIEQLSRSNEREMRAARTAETLSKVNEILLSALTLDDVVERLVGEASKAAGADKSLVIRVGDDGGYTVTHVRNVRNDLVGKPKDAAFYPGFALAAAAKCPILIADNWTDERLNKDFVVSFGLRAFQLLPLIVDGKVSHVLALSYDEVQAFDDEDNRAAERMAEAMSLALRNAYVFEAAQVAGEALRRQAELLDLSYEPIIVWRLDGAIESWNRGAQALYGYSAAEALGRITHELLQTSHPQPWAIIETALRKRGAWEGELVQRTKDGRQVVVLTRHQLVQGADGVERVLETNRDITERKRSEDRTRTTRRRPADQNRGVAGPERGVAGARRGTADARRGATDPERGATSTKRRAACPARDDRS